MVTYVTQLWVTLGIFGVTDMSKGKDYYTVKEFAELLGYSTDRVYEWVRSGYVKSYEKPSPHSIWRIPKAELDRLKNIELDKPSRREIVSEMKEQKDRDREIFNKSDQIISERYFKNMLEFLRNTCIGKSHMRRTEYFTQFYEAEVNKYINMGLKYLCYKLCKSFEELLDFWEEYSVEYIWYWRLIEAGKLEDKWHSFEVALEDESNTLYLKNERDELYLLLPNPDAFLYKDQFPKPGFPQSYPTYPNWKQELDKIITKCDNSYSEYRASVRDILYL